jgi:hypothetical protein
MTRLFDGLIHVTGESDTGKTTFALECGTPINKIAFFDHDLKASVLVKELARSRNGFGMYVNLVDARKGKTEIQFHDFCAEQIRKIPEGTETFIWDNFTPFEDTIYPKVMQDPNKYRQTWASMGAVKGAQQWDASFQLTEQILDDIMKRVPQVFIITHLKNLNIGGVRTDKMIPATKRVLPQKANMRIWLRMNPRGTGKPVGLVLKRVGKAVINEDGSFSMVNVLPRRMDPCTWEQIRWYWDNPVGLRDNEKLERDEIPSEHELTILDGGLTPDQRKSFHMMLQFGTKDEEEAMLLQAASQAERIREYKQANPSASPMDIKTALGLELAVPAILRILSEEQST